MAEPEHGEDGRICSPAFLHLTLSVISSLSFSVYVYMPLYIYIYTLSLCLLSLISSSVPTTLILFMYSTMAMS